MVDTDSVLKLDLKALKEQVAQERAEILAAPLVASSGYVQRCHFCGQLTPRGSDVQGRFRGACCGG